MLQQMGFPGLRVDAPCCARASQGVTSHLSQAAMLPRSSAQHTNSCTTWSQMGQSASSVPAQAHRCLVHLTSPFMPWTHFISL